jgi:glycosyltransferase involved in cell wall biosynthesis
MNALDAGAAVACLSLVAIWLGYPLLVRVVALARRRPEIVNPVLPTVSVVLATRAPADEVFDRVTDLLAGDYDLARLDVVVARDSGAAPLEADRFRAFDGRVSLANVEGAPGKAAALNAGVRAARGEVIVFADTHQRFRADAIRRLVSALANGVYSAVCGRLELGGDRDSWSLARLYWRLESRLRQDEARLHSTIGVTGAIYAMRRSLWVPLPDGLLLDDVYEPMSLVLTGHRIGYAGDAIATDTRRVAAAGEFRRKVRTLTGVLQLVAWMPATVVPIRNPVWPQFVFHKLLRLLTPYFALVIAGWAVVRVGLQIAHFPRSAALILGFAVLASFVSGKRLAHATWRLLVWGVALQAATVVATAYGLRGRWNVWRT